ncbi:MAG: hypothetical protein ACRCTZ_21095 [Sarcina sp.]
MEMALIRDYYSEDYDYIEEEHVHDLGDVILITKEIDCKNDVIYISFDKDVVKVKYIENNTYEVVKRGCKL